MQGHSRLTRQLTIINYIQKCVDKRSPESVSDEEKKVFIKVSLRGDVDDDADVALVLAEADVVAVDVLGRKLVDRRRLRRVGGISGRLTTKVVLCHLIN